jgi:hypothetical protein
MSWQFRVAMAVVCLVDAVATHSVGFVAAACCWSVMAFERWRGAAS